MAGRRIDSIDSPEWETLFTGFSANAFRWESLQHYTVADEAEALARFLDGVDPEIDLSWWCEMTAGHLARGHAMSRVRLVRLPESDYTRLEMMAYPVMAAAGDDIRVITELPDALSDLEGRDFWIFDDRDVWALEYDSAGSFLGAALLEDPAAIARHLRWRDTLLEHSIPVDRYLAARRPSW